MSRARNFVRQFRCGFWKPNHCPLAWRTQDFFLAKFQWLGKYYILSYTVKNADNFYAQSRLETGLIVASLCFISLIIVAFNARERTCAPKAFIYKEGSLIKKIDLGKDQEIILPDCRMEFLVKNKSIRIKESSCKNKICMRMGWAGLRQKTLVCAPNKVIVEIQAEKAAFLDAVCY